MSGAILESKSAQGWQRTNPGGNYATNGYPSRIPTTTRPDQQTPTGGSVGDGVIPWGLQGNYSSYNLMLVPYGVGTDDQTFKLQVLGWRPTQLNVGFPLWIPVQLIEVTCSLSATTGVAGSDLGTTQMFCDAITYSSGGPSLNNAAAPNTIPPIVPDFALFSNAPDVIGFLIVRGLGFPFLEVIFTTGASATSCNALWAAL